MSHRQPVRTQLRPRRGEEELPDDSCPRAVRSSPSPLAGEIGLIGVRGPGLVSRLGPRNLLYTCRGEQTTGSFFLRSWSTGRISLLSSATVPAEMQRHRPAADVFLFYCRQLSFPLLPLLFFSFFCHRFLFHSRRWGRKIRRGSSRTAEWFTARLHGTADASLNPPRDTGCAAVSSTPSGPASRQQPALTKRVARARPGLQPKS